MLPVEVHQCSRYRSLKSWALAAVAVTALMAVYAAVQYHDEGVALRAEVQAMKPRGCPARLQGRPFAGNQYREVDLMRPKYATLTCMYGRGVKL